MSHWLNTTGGAIRCLRRLEADREGRGVPVAKPSKSSVPTPISWARKLACAALKHSGKTGGGRGFAQPSVFTEERRHCCKSGRNCQGHHSPQHQQLLKHLPLLQVPTESSEKVVRVPVVNASRRERLQSTSARRDLTFNSFMRTAFCILFQDSHRTEAVKGARHPLIDTGIDLLVKLIYNQRDADRGRGVKIADDGSSRVLTIHIKTLTLERRISDNYRRLGRTHVDVSTVSFGAWAIGGTWGPVDDAESLARFTPRSTRASTSSTRPTCTATATASGWSRGCAGSARRPSASPRRPAAACRTDPRRLQQERI